MRVCHAEDTLPRKLFFNYTVQIIMLYFSIFIEDANPSR